MRPAPAVLRASVRAVRPAGGAGTWGRFLLLLLLAALAALAGRNRLAHDWATLAVDLPWAGVALALVGLVLSRWGPARATGPARRLQAPSDSRIFWIAAAGLGALALLAVLAPVLLLAGRTGLTVRTARAWGVAESGPPVRRAVKPRALGAVPSGTAPFLVASGWVYAPSSGTYAPTVAGPGPQTLWIDGSPIVVVPPAPEVEPVIGVDRGRYRENTVYLERGFHRLAAWYPAGGAPRPHWRLPYADALHRLPADHLLSDDASPTERAVRARLLAARRWGVLALAGLAVAGVAAATARVAPLTTTAPAGGLSAAGHAAVALVFFTLTEVSLLFWPGQVDTLRAALLVGIPAVVLATLALARVRGPARQPTGSPGSRSVRRRTVLALLALLAIQITLAARFLTFVDGRLPLPGDHSSFLYRYHLLLHTLPRLQGYDPWWNAGTLDPSPAMSGASGILALFWPLLWIGPLEHVYAAFVLLVGVGLAPWCLFAATRLLGGSPLAALLAGILALAPDEAYFWWFMAHGTLPATVSAVLATLTVALAWRIFVHRDPRRWLVVTLVAALALGFSWGFFAGMVVPALLAMALIHRRRLGRREAGLTLGIAAALVFVHSSWLIGIRAVRQVGYARPGSFGDVPWGRAFAEALETTLIDPNPIALVLGGAGVALLPRALRGTYLAFVASLLLTATVAQPLLRGLELHRFFIPLSFALIPPAAWVGARLLRAAARPRAGGMAAGLGLALAGLLVVHGDGVWRQYAGEVRRGASQMEFQSGETARLVEWLRRTPVGDARIALWGNLPGPGRLAGGYQAFLQPLTGRPLLGHYQNLKFVDLDVHRILTAPDVRSRLETLNVQYVVVRDDETDVRERLDVSPGLALRATLPGDFLIYEVAITPGYLIGARGAVAFDYDRLEVRLGEAAPGPVTLKFRWAPGLVSDPPLDLQPVEVLPGIRFIRVNPGAVREFRIGYVGCCPWHPFEWLARWRSGARGPRLLWGMSTRRRAGGRLGS